MVATQAGLPRVSRPYDALAGTNSASPATKSSRRLRRMLDNRRHPPHRRGAQPLRHRLHRQRHVGVGRRRRAHRRTGRSVGALEFVTHCYRRPRRLPDWPYNLFAMVHSQEPRRGRRPRRRDRQRCWAMPAAAHDILYSTAILKKTGLRIAG
jgi:hypothetical protein